MSEEDIEIMRKRIPNGENNLSNNSLMLKLSFLEKQFDNMKIRQDELEKLFKNSSSNLFNLEQKSSENDSTANTNEDIDGKYETRKSKKIESDVIFSLKNSINDLYGLIDSKHSDILKKMDEFSYKHSTKYSQITERINLSYSNISKEFEIYCQQINNKMESIKSMTTTTTKEVSFEKETSRGSKTLKDLREKYNSLEKLLNESIQENQITHKKMVSSLDKTMNHIININDKLEEKIEAISNQTENSSIKELWQKITEIESSEIDNRKSNSKIEKILDNKLQEAIKLINCKIGEFPNIFLKNTELNSIFENQSFANGIVEIVSQLQLHETELNSTFNKMNEYDMIFQNINTELKKIKETCSLSVENYQKRFSSFDSILEERFKNITDQQKIFDDLIKKKESLLKPIPEENIDKKEKEKNVEQKLKHVEERTLELEKTIKCFQNLNELNQNSLNLKFDEIELKIQNEFVKNSKIFKEMREKTELETIDLFKKIDSYSVKLTETDKSFENLKRNIEESKILEMKILEDYKNLYDSQKDPDFNTTDSNKIDINEVSLLNSINFKAKSSSNTQDIYNFNFKNIIITIESYSLKRYNLLKKQICNINSENIKLKLDLQEEMNLKLQGIDDFNSKILNQFTSTNTKISNMNASLNNLSSVINVNTSIMKKYIISEILNLNEKVLKTNKNIENECSNLSEKLKENDYKCNQLSLQMDSIFTIKLDNLNSLWDTIALFNK